MAYQLKTTVVHEIKIYGPDGELKKVVPPVLQNKQDPFLTRSTYCKRKSWMKGKTK